MTLTPAECKLAAALLEMAAGEFSNHGCNDFDLYAHMSPADAADLVRRYAEWNRDPFFEPRDDRYALGDSNAMAFMAARLRGDV